MKLLKLKIFQPEANYSQPFGYQRRLTYPIPLWSTVKGLVANVLGIKSNPNEFDKFKNILIGISGFFETKSREYIWLRNLTKSSHLNYYGDISKREKNSQTGHIGGQAPIFIDILNNVFLTIYFNHPNYDYLIKINKAFQYIEKRDTSLHLGRAEDWFVIESINIIECKKQEINGNFKRFFWIPASLNKVSGILFKMPTFYRIVNGKRVFDYVNVYLNDGIINNISTFYDEEENIPIFLIQGINNEC